jgi:TM2 domain-containing membrane protein YozV
MSTQPVPVQYISAMEQSLMQSLDEQQRVWFLRDMQMYRKDELAGVLLAVLLGSFGAHWFYLKRTGLGILYLCFFWTGLPGIIGIIDAFFMPGRVRRYNDALAVLIAGRVGAGIWSAPAAVPVQSAPLARICPHCGNAILGDARFCAHCGAQSAA